MTPQAKAYGWSAAVHGTILLAFALASFSAVPPAKIAVIDFTLKEGPAASRVERPEPPRTGPVKQAVKPARAIVPQEKPAAPPPPQAAAQRPPEAPAAPSPEAPPAPQTPSAEAFGGPAATGKSGPVPAPGTAGGPGAGEARPQAAEPAGLAKGGPAEAAAAPAVPAPEASRQAYLREHFVYIRDRINRGISYPALARKMGWHGQVKIAFVVCEDGGVADVRVLESSGFALLDRNAADTVRQVAPFPCPPVRAEIRMAITYRFN